MVKHSWIKRLISLMMVSPQITLKDVSQAAGVSSGLASVVLNGKSSRMKASEATRQKILEAAAQLGYVANQNARALRMSCSFLVGVLAYNISTSFVPEIISGIETGLLHTGYSVLLGSFHNDAELTERLEIFRKRKIDGCIVITMDNPTCHLVHRMLPRIPCTFVGCNPALSDCSSVNADGDSVGRLAAESLYAHSHGLFCHFGNSRRLRASWESRLKALGVPPEHCLDAPCHNFFEEGVSVFRRFLVRHPDISGVFADGDILGAAALKVANMSGRRVPDDLAVVGVDDSGICSMLTPELSSIRQPRREQGERASQLLLAQLQGRPAQNLILPVELITRSSLVGQSGAQPYLCQP